MALSTIVKISSINNLSDARYCAGMGVDFMGFCIDKNHSCFISPIQFKEITGWITGVKTVAEIENSSLEDMATLADNYKVNYLEVNNEKALNALAGLGKPFIYKLKRSEMKNPPINDKIHFYLIEGEKFTKNEIEELKEFSSIHSVIVNCGEDKGLVKELLNKTKIKGIELQGGQEISPGLKDFDSLSEILEMLEID